MQKAQERAIKERKERMKHALQELEKIRKTKSGEDRPPAVSSPRVTQGRDGSPLGLPHLQHPAMGKPLLKTKAGEGGGVSQAMERPEEASTATASMKARTITGGWNDGTYQITFFHSFIRVGQNVATRWR